MKRLLILLCTFGIIVNYSLALPKFAIRHGVKCQSCHINPTGKGMRSTFGSTFGREELTMPTYKEMSDFDDFSPALNDFFTVGFDYRSLYFYEQADKSNSIFQMQGDLYLDLRLNKKIRIYYDKGLYQGFEVFGLAKILPEDGYIKIGKFIPAYGTKLDDHNAFIRGGPYLGGPSTGMRFGERSEDTGLEIGVAPGIFTFNAGVFNGSPGSYNAPVIRKSKTTVVRGDALFATDNFNISVGGSYYNDPNPATRARLYGGFGAVSLFKSLTLNSEIDYIDLKSVPTAPFTTGIATYNELNYVLTQGVELKLEYEFYDPDKDLKTGSYSRITVGAEFFPFSGVEVRPLYRFNSEKPKEVSNDEFLFMIHLFL